MVKAAGVTGEETKEGETTAAATEEAKVEDAPDETKKETAPAVDKPVPVVDEEDDGKLTLAEYQALKKKSLLKKEIRAHEEVKKDLKLEAAAPKKEKVQPLANVLKDQEVYNVAVGKTELSSLLQFQSVEEDSFFERDGRRGGRGGRGGARGGRGGKPEGGHRGGR
jgi:hypothetical protein